MKVFLVLQQKCPTILKGEDKLPEGLEVEKRYEILVIPFSMTHEVLRGTTGICLVFGTNGFNNELVGYLHSDYSEDLVEKYDIEQIC